MDVLCRLGHYRIFKDSLHYNFHTCCHDFGGICGSIGFTGSEPSYTSISVLAFLPKCLALRMGQVTENMKIVGYSSVVYYKLK